MVPVLLFFLVRASVVSYLKFVLSLFVVHLSCTCLWKAMLRDSGTSGVFSLIFCSIVTVHLKVAFRKSNCNDETFCRTPYIISNIIYFEYI